MSAVQDRLLTAALKLFAEKRNKDVSVSELAREANVARSTIYKQFQDVDTLFVTVAEKVTENFNAKLSGIMHGVDDPAVQLTLSLAFPLHEFHTDPFTGRFVTEFALNESKLRKYWFGTPSHALARGAASDRFDIAPSEIPFFRAQMAGGLLSTMILVRDGHAGWREAALHFCFFQLRSLGINEEEARAISSVAVVHSEPDDWLQQDFKSSVG